MVLLKGNLKSLLQSISLCRDAGSLNDENIIQINMVMVALWMTLLFFLDKQQKHFTVKQGVEKKENWIYGSDGIHNKKK